MGKSRDTTRFGIINKHLRSGSADVLFTRKQLPEFDLAAEDW